MLADSKNADNYPWAANNIYPLIFGRHYTAADGSGGFEYPFFGKLDDIRLYKRALSDCEIAELAGTGSCSNSAPLADAGADQTITCTPAGGAAVTLDGSGSSDADGDVLSYSWSEGGVQIATGISPTVSLAPGVHTVNLSRLRRGL